MKVYAVPGLATNEGIFAGIKLYNHQLIVLKWPSLKREYSMKEYAMCFVEQINTNEPFMILGLSFGGMIAVELGKILQPEKVILISSAKTRRGLSWPIRFFKFFPVHLLIPDRIFRSFSFRARLLLGFSADYMKILAPMVKEMPENYFKYAIHYIVNWNNKDVPENTILIHGNADKLIWHNKKFADHTIQKGSHAMVITKASELNKILNEILNQKIQ